MNQNNFNAVNSSLIIPFLFSVYAMLQWACASIGAILVTLNPAYRVNEFVWLSKRS